MVWFVPDLTAAEEDRFIFPDGVGGKHLIGRWPHPQSRRVNCGFMMEHATVLAHTAANRLFCVQPITTIDPGMWPLWSQFGHWLLEVITPGHIQATCPANSFGWDAQIDIQTFSSLPFNAVPGVEWKFRLTHAATAHEVTVTLEFIESSNTWTWDRDAAPIILLFTTTTKTVGFPYGIMKFFDWAISDCYEYERDAPAPLDFAIFNGVDAYIKNRSRTNDTTGAWRQEFDIRIHDLGQHHYLCKSFNTTRFNVIYDDRITYINRPIFFTTPLNLNQWYHIDFRYQWDAADGNLRVAIDGGADDIAAATNFNARWDQFGKRGGQAPVGEFDMKNFTLKNGTAVSSTVYLDQKFQTDACDDGPDGRHGDTFNMTLPSCP